MTKRILHITYDKDKKVYKADNEFETGNSLEMSKFLAERNGITLQAACTHVLDMKAHFTGERPAYDPT